MKTYKIKLKGAQGKKGSAAVSIERPPVAVCNFLAQLNGLPLSKTDPATPPAYAAGVVAPRMGWTVEDFNAHFIAELCAPHNLRVLERESELQAKGLFYPYTISLSTSDGGVAEFLVAPRPLEGYSVASLLAAPQVAPEGVSSGGQFLRPTGLLAALEDAGPAAPLHLLQSSGERASFMRILDFFPGYVIIVDKDHKIRFENKVFRQLFGSGRSRHCYEILRDQDRPCANCPPLSVLQSQTLCVSEWACAKLGQAFRVYSYPFEEADGSQLALKVGINITAGIKAKQALDLSEQRYNSITDNLTLGIAVLDSNLHISMTNKQIKTWFPHSHEDGRTICDMLGRACSQNGDCSHCPFKATFADGGNHEYEMVIHGLAEGKGKDKRGQMPAERWYRLLSCPIKTKGGKVRSTIMLLEDISDRQLMLQRLQRVQQVEAMATLAGGIAHEINQPLSALHLYASGLQMLLEKQEDLPVKTTQERLSLIMKQAEKIREIIVHMRSLVMQEDAPTPVPVNIQEAMEGALALLGSQLRLHGVNLQLQFEKDIKPVMAVYVQLEQVFINILANAMHALDSVATQGATGGAGAPQKLIRVRVVNIPDRGVVQIEIADTGPGISSDLGEHIFDPFFTTNEGHNGMGLGLSIVHTFVHAWGGDLAVRRKHKELGGAAFYLLLPVAPSSLSNGANGG